MGFIGSALGSIGGGLLGGTIGHQKEGSAIGATLGGFLPFKKGGMVRKTGLAKLHAGEMVVPKEMVHKVPKSLKAEIKRKGGRNM